MPVGKLLRRVEEPECRIWTDVVHRSADRAAEQRGLRRVAGRHDHMPCASRNAHPIDLRLHRVMRPRRVRNQNDPASAAGERLQSPNRRLYGHDPVVNASPDIAEDGGVSVGDLIESLNDSGHGEGSAAGPAAYAAR